MAVFYDEEKEYNKALLCYLKCIAIYKEHLGPLHKGIGDCYFNMAIMYKHQFKAAKVRKLL